MAAITFATLDSGFKQLRSGVTSTTTDWVRKPTWADLVVVHLDISTAGTNTILTLKSAPPGGAPDDARAITFFTSATITAASYHSYLLGSDTTAVADAAGASTGVVIPGLVPQVLGITTTPTGSTYSTFVEFRRGT